MAFRGRALYKGPIAARNSKAALAFGVEPSNRPYRLRLARYPALAETIAAFVRERSNGESAPKIALLDVGAGDGRSLRYVEALGVADSIQFHGLELCEDRLAKMYAKPRWIQLIQGDVEKGIPTPPMPTNFDIAVCEQVLEHLRNPDFVLAEIARVLKPGGILIVGVPIFPPGFVTIRRRVVPVIDRWFGIERGHVQTFSLRSLVTMVERSARFEVIEQRGFRIISGGLLAPLENYRWWWRFNRWLGKTFPSVCIEAQVVARRLKE